MSDTSAPSRGLLVIPENINKAAVLAFARVFIGVFWLFEVTVGNNWKLGLGSGANPGWVGPGAGDTVREEIGLAVEDGTWAAPAWVFQNMIEPNAEAFSYLVIGLQVMFGLFFIFGFMIRPTALIAITFDLSVFFLGNSRIPPFFTAAHLLLLATGAGMYYGADGWITQQIRSSRRRGARAVRWLIELPLLKSPRAQTAVLAASALFATYFFMQIAMRETERLSLVAMDLAVLFGLVAAGFYFARRTTDRLQVVVALLRVFVGFKFLQQIWVWTEPGVNALPGWAGTDKLRDLFELISANHWAPLGWVVDTAVLPAMAFWAAVFAVVQFAVGAMLIVGYRTRLAATVGLVYLGTLGVLGFTRYAPFAFGLLVVVLALDAGHRLSLDSARLADRPVRYGLPIHRHAVPALVMLSAASAVALGIAVFTTGGLAPNGYEEDMGHVVAAMVALFSGMFAVIGWLQLRSGGPDEQPAVPRHDTREPHTLGV